MTDRPFLSEAFLEPYKTRKVKWGFPSGPNSLGEVTYRRTYARLLQDGSGQEVWWQNCKRWVTGTFELLRDHCLQYNLPFDYDVAEKDAQEMYERGFSFKFTPPGRGLWMMGTPFIKERGGAALNNCGFVSTENIATDLSKPFRFLMDMSMLGVGVGFDTLGAGKIMWDPYRDAPYTHVIQDSREGWIEFWGAVIDWGFGRNPLPIPDTSLVRKAGMAIKGFGGVSSGPEPLLILYDRTLALINERAGNLITSRDIVDLMNFSGACTVAGNVRRTAEIAFGNPDDEDFLDLKDYDKNPERAEWGWTSNNSVFGKVGMDYSPLSQRRKVRGEMPGIFWLENARQYGRMKDPINNRDWRVKGCNPCGEQSLESYELCCLVETYPSHHEDLADFKKTLKYAYLYAKTVTLIHTHWKETNAVMMRNRRIGASVSGVVDFLQKHSEHKLVVWLNGGYETVQHYDRVYSEWLGVRESIKSTSVKPSGTVSLLAGVRPGGHYPTDDYHLRRIRYNKTHPDVKALEKAGYDVEEDVRDPFTSVVTFPVKGTDCPTEKEVSLARKVHLASLLQKHWADNQVSYTATYLPNEGDQIEDLLRAYEDKLKAISFLPILEKSHFAQMPYTSISKGEYEEAVKTLHPIEWKEGRHDSEERSCEGGVCNLEVET